LKQNFIKTPSKMKIHLHFFDGIFLISQTKKEVRKTHQSLRGNIT